MRYAVTGATGFLGANLVRHLLDEGHDIVALIRKPNRLLDGLELTPVPVPLAEGASPALVKALEGCDGIFHVAGTFDPSPGGDERMRRFTSTPLGRCWTRRRWPAFRDLSCAPHR